MRAYYRIDHLPLLLAASDRYRVDPHLVAAVIFTESRFRHDARSSAGATGLMQLMPETAAELAHDLGFPPLREADLHNPRLNIELGVAYLQRLQRRFEQPEWMLAAYNAGPTVVDGWREEGRAIPYPETRHYVRAVLRHQARLKVLYPEWTPRTQADPSHKEGPDP